MGDQSRDNNTAEDTSDTSIFLIQVSVDGDARINSHDTRPLSAAVAAFEGTDGLDRYWYILPKNPTATTQRAKLMSVVMALDISLRKYRKAVYERDRSTLKHPYTSAPRLHLQLCSDSRYALDCLTNGSPEWEQIDWSCVDGESTDGEESKDTDLTFWALQLQKELGELGILELIDVPSTMVEDLCKQAIDYHGELRGKKESGKWVEWVWDLEE